MAVIGKSVALLLALGVLVTLSSPALAADSVTAQLSPQNNSGESGTATLTKDGSKTKVVLSVTGAPAGVNQPVHIHKGTCANLDPKPTYPLSPVVNGKSETTVNASLDDLQSGGYAINGHKSATEVSKYVFCGPIPAAK